VARGGHTGRVRKSTNLVPLVRAAAVLVDQVAGGQPVDGRVEDGYHHPTGELLLLA